MTTDMMVNRHKYFRWTGRTARITFAYMVAFPAFIGYLAYTTDVRSLGIKEGGSLLIRSLGQVGYEGEEERRYYCGILDGWGSGWGSNGCTYVGEIQFKTFDQSENWRIVISRFELQ